MVTVNEAPEGEKERVGAQRWATALLNRVGFQPPSGKQCHASVRESQQCRYFFSNAFWLTGQKASKDVLQEVRHQNTAKCCTKYSNLALRLAAIKAVKKQEIQKALPFHSLPKSRMPTYKDQRYQPPLLPGRTLFTNREHNLQWAWIWQQMCHIKHFY